jgi:hypothetical protein
MTDLRPEALLALADELEEQHTFSAFWSAVDDAVATLRAIAAPSQPKETAAVPGLNAPPSAEQREMLAEADAKFEESMPAPYTAARIAGEDRDLFTAEQMRAYAGQRAAKYDDELRAASILMHAAEMRAASAPSQPMAGEPWALLREALPAVEDANAHASEYGHPDAWLPLLERIRAALAQHGDKNG